MSDEKEAVPMKRNERGGARKLAGVLLAVMGLFWLAHKAGWTAGEHGHSALVWPLVAIGAGVFLFSSSRHGHAK